MKIPKRRRKKGSSTSNTAVIVVQTVQKRPIPMESRELMELAIKSSLEDSTLKLQEDALKESYVLTKRYYGRNIPIENVRKRTLGDLLKGYFEMKKTKLVGSKNVAVGKPYH